jgi:large subunit ribosomal protein L2
MKYSLFRIIKYVILHRKKSNCISLHRMLPLLKTDVIGFVRSNGRNHTGGITCYHKGGGHKKSYRILNSLSNVVNAIIVSVEYDPNRTCLVICLFDFSSQKFFYMPACSNSSIGDIVKTGFNAELHQGHVLELIHIPEGTLVCNIFDRSSFPLYCKSAGTFSVLLEKMKTYCVIKLPSGEYKKLRSENQATIGIVSKRPFNCFLSKKAGRSRWLNKRPTVRGVAMNPVDHPHGGGEGKKSGKKYTPWGKSVPVKKKDNVF